jgi:hypothetical protein
MLHVWIYTIGYTSDTDDILGGDSRGFVSTGHADAMKAGMTILQRILDMKVRQHTY